MIEHTVMRRSLPGKEAPARRFPDAPAAFSFLRTPCSDKAPDHGAGRGRLPARLLAAQRRRSAAADRLVRPEQQTGPIFAGKDLRDVPVVSPGWTSLL